MRILLLVLLPVYLLAQPSESEVAEWERRAQEITIIRDQWGIAHVYGHSDADAIFGMLYAQCEDDFNRVEMNYVTAIGRMAEIEGAGAIYSDLRMRLYNDSISAKQMYRESPEWLRKLCDAFADGINYYLYSHPETQPKLLTRFHPWMPFTFSEGSIGGDIESISLKNLLEFYGSAKTTNVPKAEKSGNGDGEPRGSNGIAIAPMLATSGNAMLLINPHTSFYFRDEMHVVSDEGLNSYGALTWGQFFIYQGFNEHCGWMHTSSGADVIDEFEESVVNDKGELKYKFGDQLKNLESEKISIRYNEGGKLRTKDFLIYRTHHGPIVSKVGNKWVSVSLMHEPTRALMQSYLRTKANSFEQFNDTMELRTNSSNNTVYADDQGNIAYYHGNFMPVRNPKFDWTKPIDGSDPATDWKGLHPLDEMIIIKNPSAGWIQNCNSTPFTASGVSSPVKKNYPEYMAPDAENARGLHAVRVLQGQNNFTLDKLIATAYDPYLTGFEKLVPSLIKAYDDLDQSHAIIKSRLKEPIDALRNWDLRWSESSVPTALAVLWGTDLRQHVKSRLPANIDQLSVIDYMVTQTQAVEKVQVFSATLDQMTEDFGSWRTAWGEINRYQRLTGDIVQKFDDSKPSLPVGYTSSFWGSLASVGSKPYPGTKKWYGTSGNSFVAVVEFGKTVKARTILSGGVSGDPKSPHFQDQASMFCKGQFKTVSIYREDIEKQAAQTYHPGSRN